MADLRLNRPMVERLRRCAADTSPGWDGTINIYPSEARELVALIDAANRAGNLDAIRAEVAEGIAQAIEARGEESHDFLDRAELPANPRYAQTIVLTIEQAAAIARGYTPPAGHTATPHDTEAQPGGR